MIGMGMTIIPYQAVAREVRAGQLFCARIAGVELVRETGWVYLRTNRVPRAQQAMMQMLERVRPRLKLSPGPGVRRRQAKSVDGGAVDRRRPAATAAPNASPMIMPSTIFPMANPITIPRTIPPPAVSPFLISPPTA